MKHKVLFIMHMPPPVHGASIMGENIFNSINIQNEFECSFINETISSDVSHVGKFGFYKIHAILLHCREISKAIRRIKPDLVYITPSGYQPELGMIRYVLEFGIINYYKCNKLIHLHNKGDKKKCEKWYFRWYYKMLFKHSKVIFLAPILSKQFDFILKPDQVLVCPNGVREMTGDRFIKTKHPGCVKFLFLSNLIETKGVIVLLDAMKLLVDEGLNVFCDFIGAESTDIDTSRFSHEVEKRGLDKFVKYHGKKYGSDKDIFLKSADLFVFPTFYPGECFPLVLLEAMEYSLPLISTNNGAIEEIIIDGKNGLICKQNDVVSLAEKMSYFVKNPPVRLQMGERGYQMFKEKYTIDSFERNLSNCINKALR